MAKAIGAERIVKTVESPESSVRVPFSDQPSATSPKDSFSWSPTASRMTDQVLSQHPTISNTFRV